MKRYEVIFTNAATYFLIDFKSVFNSLLKKGVYPVNRLMQIIFFSYHDSCVLLLKFQFINKV